MSVLTQVRTSEGAELGIWWGRQLDLDLGDCDPAVLNNPLALRHWATKLVGLVGMKAHGIPMCVKFGEGDLEGWTIVQLITTSNLTLHANGKTRSAFVTLFSCKEFDPEVAIAFTCAAFGTDVFRATVADRYIPVRGA